MKPGWKIWTLVGIVIALVILWKSRRAMGILWDFSSEQRLATLHPAIKQDVRRFINKAEDQGMKLRITSGYRDFMEQQMLYNKGRDTGITGLLSDIFSSSTPTGIVTNAKPGQSYHNYGLGFDVVEMKDGQPIWDNPNWPKIGALGKSFGFKWGGDWNTPDRPHFEKSFGRTTGQLLALSEAQKTPYVNLV